MLARYEGSETARSKAPESRKGRPTPDSPSTHARLGAFTQLMQGI